jgi:SnoaL-like domain
MSQENVELVRAICAPWKHGDYSSAEWAHPEIEVETPDGPQPGNWKGLAGMAEGYRDFLSAWDDVRTDVEEYRQADSERVLAFTHTSGRGKTSAGPRADLGDHCRSFPLPRPQSDEARALLEPRPLARRSRPHARGFSGVGDVAGERGGGAQAAAGA